MSTETMTIRRRGEDPGAIPPEPTFRGDVRVCDYVRRPAPSRLAGATVTFAPGARTPWKTNPLGQTIVVVEGHGRAQCAGAARVELRAGDVVWFAPGTPHWEGASPDHAMTYVALAEEEPGRTVQFGREVVDEEYGA